MDVILTAIQEESLALLKEQQQEHAINGTELLVNKKNDNHAESSRQTHFVGQLMNIKRKHITDCYDIQFNVELLHSSTVRMMQ